jgi:selenoprotein W-related protein
VLERELGTRAELIKGAGGVFDVTVDGRPVYSKHQTGRFPDPAEVLAAIRALA